MLQKNIEQLQIIMDKIIIVFKVQLIKEVVFKIITINHILVINNKKCHLYDCN